MDEKFTRKDIEGRVLASDVVVVGSGVYGLTIARLAAEAGYKALIIEKREHIGGNAWSEIDAKTGVEIHKYGSHLFHTSNEKVWEFVNRFTSFNNYRHQVLTTHVGQVFPMPVNLLTINQFFGKCLSPQEARDFIAELAASYQSSSLDNFEVTAKSLMGAQLYEAFFRGYTAKQWQTDPSNLPSGTLTRLPFRFNYDSRYFNDKYEGLPVKGYFGMLTAMAEHENIEVVLDVDFFEIPEDLRKKKPVVYTGPLDKYFDYQFGALSWRTLDFEWEIHEVDDFQGCSVMNYSDEDVPFTRIHEFRHLHPERQHGQNTIIAKEFSRMSGPIDEPYYPVNSPEDRVKLEKYRALAKAEPDVHFGGRLGTYQYLDMHMAIASAMVDFNNNLLPTL
jgi:UDP-galactopyranose mutase